ncbi:MAG: chemotaxis protein CheW [Desulfococcaceae bacterium]|jgi:purine-binding chemotaxis protein CheW|nr:chemotaxis protein CheW [Desulfococcaceae bacterium]
MDSKQNPISLEELTAQIDKEARRADEGISGGGNLGAAYSNEQYIRFMLDDVYMAVPLSAALEIGRQPRITRLPNLPGWVLGVSNIRGEIISIVDLKAFFSMSPPGLKKTQRFIIIRKDDIKTGITVDRIIGIYTPEHKDITRTQLYHSADSQQMKWTPYIAAVLRAEDSVLNILDTGKLLTDRRMNAFSAE